RGGGTVAAAPGVPQTRLVTPAVGTRDVPPPFKGARGGALATVGFVTLAVLGIVAETDRRKMRNALRAQGGAAS
ncbi:MAG: hypothetical protein M3394_02725, partial [Actinomycetota bacterium]|nr:hypothetical protein [Actinomycetota bacterium]